MTPLPLMVMPLISILLIDILF